MMCCIRHRRELYNNDNDNNINNDDRWGGGGVRLRDDEQFPAVQVSRPSAADQRRRRHLRQLLRQRRM